MIYKLMYIYFFMDYICINIVFIFLWLLGDFYELLFFCDEVRGRSGLGYCWGFSGGLQFFVFVVYRQREVVYQVYVFYQLFWFDSELYCEIMGFVVSKVVFIN